MPRPTLLGFGGRPASGKDASADHLVDEHGWTKVNMSAAIHQLMSTINPIVGTVERSAWRRVIDAILEREPQLLRYNDLTEQVGFTDAKKHPEYRRLLQDLGAGAREVIAADVWVDIAARAIDELLAFDQRVLLSGVRTPSEIDLIRTRGGIAVWVDRPGHISGTAAQSHDIENAVSADMFDTVIVNDGSLTDLHRKVADLAGAAR